MKDVKKITAQLTLRLLKRARKRISTPKRWTRDAFARNHDGADVSEYSEAARAWCAYGALEREATERDRDVDPVSAAFFGTALGHAHEHLHAELPPYWRKRSSVGMHCRLTEYNDAPRRTHAQVMAWFDRAIKRAEGAVR